MNKKERICIQGERDGGSPVVAVPLGDTATGGEVLQGQNVQMSKTQKLDNQFQNMKNTKNMIIFQLTFRGLNIVVTNMHTLLLL